MSIFSNREIAIGIWVAVVLCVSLAFGPVRKSVRGVLRAFFLSKIFIVWGAAMLYIGAVIAALDAIGLWPPGQIKNSIIWAITAGLVSFLSVQGASQDERYFRHALTDNFKLIIAVEFIVNFYQFSLCWELFIVPVSVCVAWLLVMAERNEKHAAVARLFETIVLCFGVFVVVRAAVLVYEDVDSLINVGTLADFLVPIVLSVLFLPFLYFLSIFMRYETVFIRVNYAFKDKRLGSYAKWAAFVVFRHRSFLLERWSQRLHHTTPSTPKEVRASLRQILKEWKCEQNPPVIPQEDGWSPYLARGFLTDIDLKASNYRPDSEGVWYCETPLTALSEELTPNYVAYYVEGVEIKAQKLKLKLYLNDPSQDDKDIGTFRDIANALCDMALGHPLPKEVSAAILKQHQIEHQSEGKLLSVHKGDHLSGHGYDLTFQISLIGSRNG